MARRTRSSVASRYVSDADKAFLELARKRFAQANEADQHQRTRELEDLQFYAGEQWPQDVINAREGQPGNAASGLPPVPARPTYVINKVRSPVRQVLNQERGADLGVDIVAVDDFGDETPGMSPQEIELREGLVRRLQRESQAADARSWAFMRAVIAGRGYYRVMTRYLPGKTNDQEIYVDRIYNQASVSLDPTHEQPDGSDAEWGFIGTDVPWERYKAEYGVVGDETNPLIHASDSEWRTLGDELPGWFSMNADLKAVRVVEYWYVERTAKTLVTLDDGSVLYDDEVPAGAKIIDRRQDIQKAIKWAKIDGVQVLDETDWPGQYLPIIKVLGEELQPWGSERRSEGMVRPARDSQRGFNVMVSKWVEQIGLAPIPPWMGAAGFDEGFEQEYALANTRALSALHYNTVDTDGRPIPPPSRTSITMEIEAIAGSVKLLDEAIRDTTAVPDPSLGNVDSSLKTARGLKMLLDQAQKGTGHFLDNLARSIRYEGLILNDLLYPIYGARPGRLARVMDDHGETQAVILHKPFVPHPTHGRPVTVLNGQPITRDMPQAQLLTLTPDATFNATVTVTKNYDTRREQQEAFLTQIVESDPQQMQIVGDLLFKYNDGPGHDELERRYQAVLAPPVAALVNGQQPIPPQVHAQMAQMQAQMQQLQQLADKNKTDLMKTQLSEQAESQRTAQTNQTSITKAEIAAAATTSVAQAKIDAENLRSYVDALETRLGKVLDLHMAKLDQVHQMITQQADQAHDAGLQFAQHAHEQQMANTQAQHAQALQASQAGLHPNGEGNGEAHSGAA